MSGPPALSRRRLFGLAGAGALLGLAGCATSGDVAAPAGTPWPARPSMRLAVDVADDLRSVTGTEHIRFTPDTPITEVVLRAWPNRPSGTRSGTALSVTGARVGGVPVSPRVEAGGALPGAPGTLVELPLPRPVAAGTAVDVDVAFTLALGADPDERFGASPDTRTAWFGSGHPMLAWVRGRGWVRDDAVDLPGETTTSEDARLDALEVTAPTGLAVAGVGAVGPVVPGPRAGTVTHTFTADAVRDVAVAVGRYDVTERDLPGGARLHLHTPSAGTVVDKERWAETFGAALARILPLLGPLPMRDLWAVVVPSQSSGIEFPGALQFGDVEADDLDTLVAHELAHQWFYGLVGNDQARDPWLDESFATFVEVLTTGESGYGLADVDDDVLGDLGDPMRRWAARGDFDLYYEGVYRQGAAVLLEARRRAGAVAFDDALRRYVAVNAHSVAAPAALATAFADVPAALDLLTSHGALPPRG